MNSASMKKTLTQNFSSQDPVTSTSAYMTVPFTSSFLKPSSCALLM